MNQFIYRPLMEPKKSSFKKKLIALLIAGIIGIWTINYFYNHFPAASTPTGEKHPDLLRANNLKEWVKENCAEGTMEVYPYVKWYAEYQKVKPEIIFAIAWADSQCGKYLTTPNNPGNVGNTDGGQRVGFKNAFDGWKAIVDTLNNQNLNGIEKLGHLSQGGRNKMTVKFSCHGAPSPYKCYATSESNWSINTIRALQSMGITGASEYTNIRL